MMTSIVIPTHNGLRFTRNCIESIRQHTRAGTYEIIVVDNGSTDGTAEWLQAQPDVRLIRNRANEGFPRACNRGMSAATGDNLLLLNNDTLATPRWLKQLTAALHSEDGIGAVGPVTNAASYYTSMPVTYRNTEEMTRFADEYNRTDPDKWEERLKLIAFCLLLKREVYERVGPLDERFSPGNLEDDDYSVRIRLAGYRLLLCTDTFVHHEGTATFKENMAEYAWLLQKNTYRFTEKWGFPPDALQIRLEFVNWIREPKDKPLRILELECACGGTLLELKDRYRNAELFGIERQAAAAEIAALAASVTVGNSESVRFPEPYGTFDYILIGDSLEYHKEPKNLLRRFIPYLKDDGQLLARVRNVGYHATVRNLLRGDWPYTNDRAPLRFFTLDSVSRLFENAGFVHLEYAGQKPQTPMGPRDEQWIQETARKEGEVMVPQWTASHFLIKAFQTRLSPGRANSAGYGRLKRLVRRLEWEVTPALVRMQIGSLFAGREVQFLDASRILERHSVNRAQTAAKLAQILAETGVVDSEEEGIRRLLEGMENG
jgi:GT2 family glycosyltransferase